MTKSQVFLFFCFSFLFGVLIASFFKIPQIVFFILAGLAIISIAIFWPNRKEKETASLKFIFGFCLLFFALGLWRFQTFSALNDSFGLATYNGQGKINFNGVIIEKPEIKGSQQRLIAKGEINGNKGKVLITAQRYPEYEYGDELEISGKLDEPKDFSNDFSYKDYLAKDEIYSVMYQPEIKIIAKNKASKLYGFLYAIRSRFEEKINSILPEPQASFLSGLILGEKKAIPEDFSNSLKATGTVHLVALSGYNITIIASSLMAILSALMVSRRFAFWLAAGAIFLFVAMTGAASSAVRAAVMGILILIARKEGRLYNAINALVFAAAVMVFLNPKILKFDMGFQLSFLATCGLLYFSPILAKKMEKLPEFFSLKDSLVSTLSAQIFVLPLLVYSFGNLSLISPLANVLVLPIIPITMFFGFLTGLAGFIFLPLAKIFSWLSWLLLSYGIKIIEELAKLPFASVSLNFSWLLFAAYCLFLAWIVYNHKKANSENKFKKL